MKDKFIIIAGPCLAESEEIVAQTTEQLSQIAGKYNIDFYYKASFRKANRTSINSFQGVGDELALEWIKKYSSKYNLRSLTDIHTPDNAQLAAKYVDVLQIPAFLSRQTDLLIAAGNTGKIINIKKAQFMAPKDVIKAAEKVISTGNNQVWLTERGTFFGYHDLVVDMRSLIVMKSSGLPVIYDATHSLQQPSVGEQSGGYRQFIKSLVRSAVAIGIDGVFFETHPKPEKAESDSATQIKLDEADNFIYNILELNEFIKRQLNA